MLSYWFHLQYFEFLESKFSPVLLHLAVESHLRMRVQYYSSVFVVNHTSRLPISVNSVFYIFCNYGAEIRLILNLRTRNDIFKLVSRCCKLKYIFLYMKVNKSCKILYAPRFWGHIVFVLSICLSFCISVVISNLCYLYNFWTVRDRYFTFGMQHSGSIPRNACET